MLNAAPAKLAPEMVTLPVPVSFMGMRTDDTLGRYRGAAATLPLSSRQPPRFKGLDQDCRDSNQRSAGPTWCRPDSLPVHSRLLLTAAQKQLHAAGGPRG